MKTNTVFKPSVNNLARQLKSWGKKIFFSRINFIRFKVNCLSFIPTKPKFLKMHTAWQIKLLFMCTFESNLKFKLVCHF